MEHKFTLEELPISEMMKNFYIEEEIQTHPETVIQIVFGRFFYKNIMERYDFAIYDLLYSVIMTNADYRVTQKTGDSISKCLGIWIFGDGEEKNDEIIVRYKDFNGRNKTLLYSLDGKYII